MHNLGKTGNLDDLGEIASPAEAEGLKWVEETYGEEVRVKCESLLSTSSHRGTPIFKLAQIAERAVWQERKDDPVFVHGLSFSSE